MRTLIVGANGRVGRLVLAQALADGHEVTAFMRSARALPAHPNLTVVLGSVVDEPKRVREVMVRHDAVISGLGNPLWLAGKRGPAIVADSMRNVVDAMSEVGMGRMVVPLAWGTGASRSHVSPLVRVVATTLIRRDFRDFGAAEKIIASSDLEWTIAYFGFLTEAPAGTAYAGEPGGLARRPCRVPRGIGYRRYFRKRAGRDQWPKEKVRHSMNDLNGKTVIITGASAGTGAAAARELHCLGDRVVPVSRSAEKTRAVASELGVRPFTVDFGSLAAVRRMADDLLDTFSRIDILALNAGAIVPGGRPTVDGIEPTFQVNALGPWLLMRLLAPHMNGGRVISTSSRSHVGAKLDPRSIEDIKGMRPHAVYARAKLAFGMLLREFGRRTPEVTVADFHPGIIASDFGCYMGSTGAILKKLSRPFLDTPEDGARRLMHLVTTDEYIDGHYFVNELPTAGSPLLDDHALARELWIMSEGIAAKYGPAWDVQPISLEHHRRWS